jgi:Tol biopolymer transport system component
MSPEQARGAAADRRSDIWSFGVILYEMLTGRQIFGGETISDSLAAVLKTEPDWSALPHGTPAAIRRLLRRSLERDRKRRLPDIADARLEIDEALAAPAETPARQAAPDQPRSAFRWLNTVIAVAALIGLAALAFVHFRETPSERSPIRFQIPPPEKGSFERFGMALSPDGRRLAFIAANADHHAMLWLRPLDAVSAHPVPGTEGASFLPWWSPDSRSIAFGVQGKLKRVEVAGGPVQTLCEISGQITGGSWGRDGSILFGSATTGVLRASQGGGVPSRLTTPDFARGEVGHLRPWFLPDGRHFLYYGRFQKIEDSGIYLATTDGKVRKKLVGSRQAAAYAAPVAGAANGYVLFLRENTLMAQPLDLRHAELTGDPVPVAEPVGASLALGFFSVSTSGVLAYRAGSFLTNASQLVWFDRAGKSLATVTPRAGAYASLSLSQDEKHIAVDQVDQGNRDVWTMESVRGVPARFTFDAGVDILPLWSRDGSRVVFGSDRNGSYEIYEKDARGAGSEKLLLKNGIPCDWSPDGRYLLFSRNASNSRIDLWVASFNQGAVKEEPYLQSPFDERQGQFSPDGRWVAYISDESSNQSHVYVQSFPAGAGKFQISPGPGAQPRWRRDGKELFYLTMNGTLMAVDIKTSPGFEAGAPKQLFPSNVANIGSGSFAFNYDVSADGKRFLVNSYTTTAETPPEASITVVLNWQSGLR